MVENQLNYFHEAKAHFVASHQHPINQMLHHLTNLLAIAAVVSAILRLAVDSCLLSANPSALGGMHFLRK